MARTGRVFLSYRREDSKHAAARIGERLDEHFQLFMDVDAIQPGMDFTQVMTSAVAASDVVVVVIGNNWLGAMDTYGRRRLDDPGDFVATEIGAALQRQIMIIPVLVDGARMPTRYELPPSLADLSSRQALSVAHETFAADTARLVSVIENLTSLRAAGGPPDRIASAGRQSAGASVGRNRRLAPLLIALSVVAVLAVVVVLLVNQIRTPSAGNTPGTTTSAPVGPVSTPVETPPAQPPNTPPPTPAATPAGAQAALVAHVPPAYTNDCRQLLDHQYPVLAKNLVVSVRCYLVSGQPDAVEYYQYESAEAMQTAFDALFDPAESGACMTAPGTDRYTIAGNASELGVLHCFKNDNQQINYVWTREDSAIMGWTFSKTLTFPAMYAFWTTAGPY